MSDNYAPRRRAAIWRIALPVRVRFVCEDDWDFAVARAKRQSELELLLWPFSVFGVCLLRPSPPLCSKKPPWKLFRFLAPVTS
jgi:hypothetical protein